MRSRLPLYLFLAVFAVACAGDSAESGAMAEVEDEAEAVVTSDAAAVAALSENFVTHYNLHHASMVADLFTDEGFRLNADGDFNEGREEIEAALEASMASSPTLSVSPAEQKIIGDWAVTRGSYGVEATPEGMEAAAWGGSYLSLAQRVEGEWKIALTITNYDATPAEGWPYAEPGEPPEEVMDGPFADLLAGYVTHYNLGHPSMVGDFYADDAVASFADGPVLEGRDAIVAALEARLAAGGSQLAIHNVGTFDLGEGWYIDGGWYEITVSTPDGESLSGGSYMTLATKADDGTSLMHWLVTNGQPMDD